MYINKERETTVIKTQLGYKTTNHTIILNDDIVKREEITDGAKAGLCSEKPKAHYEQSWMSKTPSNK